MNNTDFFILTRSARSVFIILYSVANIYAGLVMASSGHYVGDYGFPIGFDVPIFFLLALILLSYYLVCGPVYNLGVMFKVKIRSVASKNKITYFGFFVLILQLCYFVFNVKTGVNSAGASNPEGFARFIWLLIPVDYIFYIFYIFSRERTPVFARVNLIVFMISQLSRGWLGWILIVFYIELCFFFKNNSYIGVLKVRNVLKFIVLLPLIFTLPFLMYLKVIIREALANENMAVLYSAISKLDFNVVIASFVDAFFFRLQQLSNVAFVYENSYFIEHLLQTGRVASFYWEGLLSQSISKFININPGDDIHVFLYSYFVNSNAVTETTLQTGFVSWFFFDMGTSVLYVIYTTLLIFTSIYLSKKTRFPEVQSLTWFFVLLYLMNGWFVSFLFYIQALIFVCLFMNFSFKEVRT